MQADLGIIATRSERQAMDWSLVLASQDIAATIVPADAEHGWQLVVDPAEFERAVAAIRAYRAENRARVWLRPLPWTGLVFDWRSAGWIILLAVVYWLDAARPGGLRVAGMMDNQAVFQGAWWRLFTAVLLHGDLPHLATNATIGLLLLGLAMGHYGTGLALLASFLAGAGGNVAALLVYAAPHRGLGASGMVMGALGLLTAQSVALARAGLAPRQLAVRAAGGGLLLLVLLGLSPQPETDVVAHLGGFAGGMLLGALLATVPATVRQNVWLNRAAELATSALVVLTWALALAK
jgi:membrane associated rhomboid family serine protease